MTPTTLSPPPTLKSIQARAVGGVPGIWWEAGSSGCVGKNKSYPHPDHNTINPSSIISALLLPTTCPCPCPPGPGAVGGLPGGVRPAPGRAALPAPGGASPQLPVRPLQLPPGKLSEAGWRRAFAAPRQACTAMMESTSGPHPGNYACVGGSPAALGARGHLATEWVTKQCHAHTRTSLGTHML